MASAYPLQQFSEGRDIRMRSKLTSFLLVAAVVYGAAPGVALAGGFEHGASGTRPLGRGGAFAARADDPMAMQYDPANLAALPGMQLSLNANVDFYSSCFTRTGRHGAYADFAAAGAAPVPDGMAGNGTVYTEDVPSAFGLSTDVPPQASPAEEQMMLDSGTTAANPRVCNSGPPGIIPALLFTWRIRKDLGVGIGLLADNAAGHTLFGSATDGTVAFTGVGSAGGRIPSPARYNLIEQNLVIAFPSVTVAYAPDPRFRFGVTFGSGFGIFDFTSITRGNRGEEYGQDIYTKLHAVDAFIPRITASVHIVPIDSLDIVASFMWQDDVHATGNVDLEGTFYDNSPGWTHDKQHLPSSLDAPQPWHATVAVRYADRIAPRPADPTAVSRLSGRVEDQMSNERWDIELDATYEMNSRVDEFTAHIPNQADGSRPALIVESGGSPLSLPENIHLAHQWRDQLRLNLGGDYNVIPGLAALRAGVSFETSGLKRGFTQVDFIPGQRVGLHGGLTVRLGQLDISLAYAHVFQRDETVTEGDSSIVQTVALDQAAIDNNDPASRQHTNINAGHFTASYNIASLALNYHFQ